MILHGSVAFDSYSMTYDLGESPLNVPLIFFFLGKIPTVEKPHTLLEIKYKEEERKQNTWRMRVMNFRSQMRAILITIPKPLTPYL